MKTLSMFNRRSHGMVIGVLPSLLVVVGGNFLRRTIVEAGHVSSQDARTTLWNAKPSVHAPFKKEGEGYRL